MTKFSISTDHDEITDTIHVALHRDTETVGRIVMNPETNRMKYYSVDAAFDPIYQMPIVNIFDLFRVVLNALHEHTDDHTDVPYMLSETVPLKF